MRRHIKRGDKYARRDHRPDPVRDASGPARLLNVVEGRSKKAFKTWLAA